MNMLDIPCDVMPHIFSSLSSSINLLCFIRSCKTINKIKPSEFKFNIKEIITDVAKYDSITLFYYFFQDQPVGSYLSIFVKYGSIQIIQYFHENSDFYFEYRNVKLCGISAKAGKFVVTKYLHSIGYPLPDNICEYAIGYKDISMYEWCLAKGCKYTKNEGSIAAKNHVWNTLKYLASREPVSGCYMKKFQY